MLIDSQKLNSPLWKDDIAHLNTHFLTSSEVGSRYTTILRRLNKHLIPMPTSFYEYLTTANKSDTRILFYTRLVRLSRIFDKIEEELVLIERISIDLINPKKSMSASFEIDEIITRLLRYMYKEDKTLTLFLRNNPNSLKEC